LGLNESIALRDQLNDDSRFQRSQWFLGKLTQGVAGWYERRLWRQTQSAELLRRAVKNFVLRPAAKRASAASHRKAIP